MNETENNDMTTATTHLYVHPIYTTHTYCQLLRDSREKEWNKWTNKTQLTHTHAQTNASTRADIDTYRRVKKQTVEKQKSEKHQQQFGWEEDEKKANNNNNSKQSSSSTQFKAVAGE